MGAAGEPEEGAERKGPEKVGEPKPEPLCTDIKYPEEGAERKGGREGPRAEAEAEAALHRQGDNKDPEEERKGVIGGEEKPKPKPKPEAAIVDGTEPDERKVIEDRLAARYDIPVKVFSAGSPSGCILVFSFNEFLAAARARRDSSPMYIMPYIPPHDALSIEAHLNKEQRLRRRLVNPDVLASKVSAKHAIEALCEKARALLLAPEEDNKESRKMEHRERMEMFSVALELVTFRGHMKRRLLLAYAAQGKWLMVRSFLAQLFPSSYSDVSMSTDNLKRTIQIMKTPYPEVNDVRGVSSELISVLAIEHWNEELYKAQGRPASERIDHFVHMSKEYSLIGASNIASALTIMKKVLREFISVGIAKGGLAEGFVWSREAKVARVELENRARKLINDLIDQTCDVPIKFDEMAATMEQLMQIAIRGGAERLRTKCQNFIECCQQLQDKEECRRLLSKVESELSDVTVPLDNIFELQKLIQLVEGRG